MAGKKKTSKKLSKKVDIQEGWKDRLLTAAKSEMEHVVVRRSDLIAMLEADANPS